MMDADHAAFFIQAPEAFPIYERIRETIYSALEGVSLKVQKTQISFSNRHVFAVVSLPQRRTMGRPHTGVILTLGLGYRLEDPRVMAATEPYPRRWTHHVLIHSVGDVDAQIKEWLSEAYHFANAK